MYLRYSTHKIISESIYRGDIHQESYIIQPTGQKQHELFRIIFYIFSRGDCSIKRQIEQMMRI